MNGEPPPSPVYLRAWTRQHNEEEPKPVRRRARPEIRFVLVLDTETTTETTQRLAFGSARLYRVGKSEGVDLVLRDEWLFYADDLPDRDPDGYAVLVEYAQVNRLRLLSRTEFVNNVFWKAAFKLRATVVGFNLPFDLSRLALGWGESRRDPGFSLRLWGRFVDGRWDDHPYRPRLSAQKLAPGRALIRFRRRHQPDPDDLIPEGEWEPDPTYTFTGHFLDLHTLVFALTNRRTSLARACDMFDVPVGKGTTDEHGAITSEYIDYNRRDVEATAGLFTKAYAEFLRHPIDLQPTKAYSPASMGKAYLKAMGVIPPLEKWPDFPDKVIGWAMTAYYGGRAKCRIRHVPVPVVTVDFLSMYTSVCALLGVWQLLTARHLTTEDVTVDVQNLLDQVAAGGPEVVFDRNLWPLFAGFAQIVPEGDILPVRAGYGTDHDRPQIGVNPFWADEAFWYSIPDLVASTLITGRAPHVVQAIRLRPTGVQKGLKPVRLRGEVDVDPTQHDFFGLVVEERERSEHREDLTPEEQGRLDTGLKTVANSTAYGITAEMIRHEGKDTTVTVYGLGDPYQAKVKHPEHPGTYCFPPFAAVITGGARLMLALLERLVTDHGGTYVNCDTDSMAIVARPRGGLIPCERGPHELPDGTPAIRALTYGQVDQIVAQFDRIHPYDRDAVPGPLLEIEAENYHLDTGEWEQLWCFATSAKRYVLWNRTPSGDIVIRKASEHGLGHLLDPTGKGTRAFAEIAWRMVLAHHLDIPTPDPDWLDRPAVSRLVASTPNVLEWFRTHNQDRDYADQVKPFGFMLTATPKRVAGILLGVDRLHLVAPYETRPYRWTEMEWIDIRTGQQHTITTTISPVGPAYVPVKTLRDIIDSWATNPELKSLGPDGTPCHRDTTGILTRRPVKTIPALVTFIGKQSNHLEEAQAGLFTRRDILNEYPDPDRDPWRVLVVPALEHFNPAEVAKTAGVDRRTIERLAKGTRPTQETACRVLLAVSRLVGGTGSGTERIEAALQNFLDTTPDPVCVYCGQSLTGRRRGTKYCGDACRMAFRRARRSAGTG